MRRLVLLCVMLWVQTTSAQTIVVEEGVRAGGLWCFPISGRTSEYRYLPAGLRLGQSKTGKPELSFLRYVENKKSSDAGPETITQADGGGILHFLIEMYTPDSDVRRAESEIAIKTGGQVKLVGPISMSRCRYYVVSSLATSNGKPRLFMSGQAPVFEGQKIAVALGLDKREAQILMASFQTDTPDVSVVFEAEFEGLTKAYQADVTVDWSLVNKLESLRTTADSIFSKLEVTKVTQELQRSGAIKVETRGESATGEALTFSMVDRMSQLLFRREELPPETIAQEPKEGGVLGFLRSAANLVRGMTLNPLDLNVSHNYRLRQLQSVGKTTFSLNSQVSTSRTAMVAYNLGDIYKRFGSDPSIFRLANLSDPAYDQREVIATVDLANATDFDQYVNSIGVTLRKKHENGTITMKEFVIDSASFKESKNRFGMLYGVNGDKDRVGWMSYDYRVTWSFRDGGKYSQDWKSESDASVNLSAPFQARTITIDGDTNRLKEAKVRFALIKMEYDQFGHRKRIQIPYRVESNSTTVVLVQPKGNSEYDLSIEWTFEDGTKQVQPFTKTDSSLILVDIIPQRKATQ